MAITQAKVRGMDNDLTGRAGKSLLESQYRYVVNKDKGNDAVAEPNSQQYAFATIQGAINAAAADALTDAVVAVLPGTYNERLTLKNGVNVIAVDNGVVKLEINSASTGDMISNGSVAGVIANMLGKWSVRRLGAPSGGQNSLVTSLGLGSILYIEFVEMYNGCTTTQETHNFETGNGGGLKLRQVAPGLCQSLTYDMYVDYGAPDAVTRSLFELDAWDLIQAGQSLVEMSGGFNNADVYIKGRRMRSGAGETGISVTLTDDQSTPKLKVVASEYIYAPNTGVFGLPNDSGVLDVDTPLIYAAGGQPIVFGGSKATFKNCDIVAAGSNITTVQNVAGLLRFINCRFFPTGTGKPIDTGTVECYNCFTKIANSGPTIVGALTTATGMAVPANPTT